MSELFSAPRRISVFFYGLFMDAELLREKGIRPVNIRIASVEGFDLHIGQRASLLPHPKSRVYGLLMELPHMEIDQLYSESNVRAYRPEAVVADLADGSRVPALCFNLPETTPGESQNLEYTARLRDLGRRLGLPSAYLEKIRLGPG